MGIITKGMGAIMKSKMRKAFVDKPTFPGPNVTNILNREIQKKRKHRGQNREHFIEKSTEKLHKRKVWKV